MNAHGEAATWRLRDSGPRDPAVDVRAIGKLHGHPRHTRIARRARIFHGKETVLRIVKHGASQVKIRADGVLFDVNAVGGATTNWHDTEERARRVGGRRVSAADVVHVVQSRRTSPHVHGVRAPTAHVHDKAGGVLKGKGFYPTVLDPHHPSPHHNGMVGVDHDLIKRAVRRADEEDRPAGIHVR